MSSDFQPGWYPTGQGEFAYWNGSEWLQRPQQRETYHQRRNNVLPGIVTMLGTALLLYSTTQPWIRVAGPEVTISLGQVASSVFQPGFSPDADSAELRTVLAVCAAIAAGFCLFWIFSRGRGVGPVWRVMTILALALPAALFFPLWDMAHQNLSDMTAASGPVESMIRVVDDVAMNLGLYSISPDWGLYLWGGGLALAAIGLIIPAGKSVERVL